MKSTTTTARSTAVDQAVLAELALVDIDDPRRAVTIGRKLERKLYLAVNAVLEAVGGRWDRAAKAHMFLDPPREALEAVIATGRVVTHADLGWFATPHKLAKHLAERAQITAGATVLEPSAGEGALAIAARDHGAVVTCAELNAGRAAKLRARVFETIEGDFLAMEPRTIGGALLPAPRLFDRVLMNPPFSPGRADLAHVEHALKFVARGGRLVSVMSGGVVFREDSRTRAFRAMVAEMGGTIETLPERSFESSGTAVNTCVVEVPR